MSKKKSDANYFVTADDDSYIGLYVEPQVLLHDYDEYEKFIKGIELAVRKDDRYTEYVGKLHKAGLNRCAILGNLTVSDSSADIEMHHGPIFNLFDICDIVTRALFARKEPEIDTFKVADIVLEEHRLDNIQVVMLSKTGHKSTHNGDSFIHIKATVGRIDRFIDRWHDGLQREHKQYISRYIKQCKNYDETIDNGLFDVAEKLSSFKE